MAGFLSMGSISTECLTSEGKDIESSTSIRTSFELENGYKKSADGITEKENIKYEEKGIVRMLSEGIGDRDRHSAMLEEQQQKTDKTKLGIKESEMSMVDDSSCQVL